MDELTLMQGMTDQQRLLFSSEMSRRRKDRTVGLLLCLFLGGLGVHRFYLGQVGMGVLYLLFCWTFIPLIVAFVELFLIMGRVDRHNERQAEEVALKVRALSPGGGGWPPIPQPLPPPPPAPEPR